MKTATLIRALPEWTSDASLYYLQDDGHVIVSARTPTNGDHGSVILTADANANVTDWEPLHRSDATDHAVVLAEIGYERVTA